MTAVDGLPADDTQELESSTLLDPGGGARTEGND